MSLAPNLDTEALGRNLVVRTILELTARTAIGPLYLVGGRLRDLLLGLAPVKRIDLDLVVWGEPARLARAIAEPLGATIVPFDPDTIRVLARCEGGPARIDISRPKGDTIESDLAARDFTVNAIAVRIDAAGPGATMVILDPSGGLEDLRQRSLRAVAPSAFDRDPVRLIRAVRLAAQLGFTIEVATRHAIIQRAPLLASASGERVRDELFQIIDQTPAGPSIELLEALHLLKELIPESDSLKLVPASPPHRLPLWEHSLETLRSVELLLSELGRVFPDDASWLSERLDREIEAGVTTASIVKLVGLLHDVGKPETRTVEPDGRVRFIGHDRAGVAIIARLCKRLRLGRRATELACQIVRHHLRPLHLSREGTATASAKYRLFRVLGDASPVILLHSWADLRATTGEGDPTFQRHQEFLSELLRFHRTDFVPTKASPLLRGDDLIGAFGLAPGPLLGFVLERLREAQATGIVGTREQAREYLRQHLAAWRESFERSLTSTPGSAQDGSANSPAHDRAPPQSDDGSDR
jgi:putative nucleotidyltransferase with HDIG domain